MFTVTDMLSFCRVELDRDTLSVIILTRYGSYTAVAQYANTVLLAVQAEQMGE